MVEGSTSEGLIEGLISQDWIMGDTLRLLFHLQNSFYSYKIIF